MPLRELPITQQLFLWSVRHVICAAEDRRQLCPLVEQFYADAGLPRMIGLITALLRTVSATARESFTVNVPCGAQVMPDETLLLQDLFGHSDGRCRASALGPKLVEGGDVVVGRRLADVAGQFQALEAMRGSAAHCAPAAVH
jgi:hypothetical protein